MEELGISFAMDMGVFLTLAAGLVYLYIHFNSKLKDMGTLNAASGVNDVSVVQFGNNVTMTSKDGKLTVKGAEFVVDGSMSVTNELVVNSEMRVNGNIHLYSEGAAAGAKSGNSLMLYEPNQSTTNKTRSVFYWDSTKQPSIQATYQEGTYLRSYYESTGPYPFTPA